MAVQQRLIPDVTVFSIIEIERLAEIRDSKRYHEINGKRRMLCGVAGSVNCGPSKSPWKAREEKTIHMHETSHDRKRMQDTNRKMQ